MSCAVGCRYGSDSAFQWLWCRPASVAPIRPLAWETPYAVGEAQKKREKKEVQGHAGSFEGKMQPHTSSYRGSEQNEAGKWEMTSQERTKDGSG